MSTPATTTPDKRNPFFRATRKKLRFPSNRGTLSVEELWDLSLESLDVIAVKLAEEISRQQNVRSFISDKPNKEASAQALRFEVVKTILDTKVADRDRVKLAAEKAATKATLKDLLLRRQDEKNATLTEEQIRAQLAALGDEDESED